jgi:ribosome biogenesis SPOUT family RNA methylase Rps3
MLLGMLQTGVKSHSLAARQLGGYVVTRTARRRRLKHITQFIKTLKVRSLAERFQVFTSLRFALSTIKKRTLSETGVEEKSHLRSLTVRILLVFIKN